jgi:hypothetical protein
LLELVLSKDIDVGQFAYVGATNQGRASSCCSQVRTCKSA